MSARQAFRYIVASLVLVLPLAAGCGKSDKGPPPGATYENGPPNVTIEPPAGSQPESKKPAEGTGKPAAEQGEK